MEYIIKEFNSNNKYNNFKYWFIEDKTGKIIAVAELREFDNNIIINNIDSINNNEDILEILMNKVIKYAESKKKSLEMDILDNMVDIIKILNRNKFNELYRSHYIEDISVVKFYKIIK